MAIAEFGSFEEAKAFLNRFTNYERVGAPVLRRGDRDRMARLLHAVGNPHTGIPAVHVTGSKGKGTFCLVLEALLRGAGKKVGTYLSPHLECLTERIRIEGRPVSRTFFAASLSEIRNAVQSLEDPPTYFEILTALGWYIFKKTHRQISIIEAGIGARHDATSLLRPCLCAVTSIEREHTNVLGRTRLEILREKLGSAQAGVPLLLGPLCPQLRESAARYARQQGADFFPWEGSIRVRFRALGPDGSGRASVTFASPFPEGTAAFQAPNRPFAINAALALGAFRLLVPSGGVDPAPILEQCRVPGREEVIPGQPTFVLDVAHTYHSLKALKELIARISPTGKAKVIFSLSRGKNPHRLVPVAASFAERLYLLQADPDRGLPPEELLRYAPGQISTTCSALKEALEAASACGTNSSPVCACGSFALVGQVRTFLREAGRVPQRT